MGGRPWGRHGGGRGGGLGPRSHPHVVSCFTAPTTPPFKTARLPSSATSQLGLIHDLEVAVIGRRIELESCVVPVVVAERPAVVGELHRIELESCVVPVVVAERPVVVGEVHPRAQNDPPPLS